MLAAGGAGILAIMLASQQYVWLNLWPSKVSWWLAAAWSVPQLLAWGVVVPLVYAFSARYPLDGASTGLQVVARLVIHAVASVLTAVGVLLALQASDAVLHWTTAAGAPTALVASFRYTRLYLHVGLGIYWVVLAAEHSARYYRSLAQRDVDAHRAQTALAEAQLRALREQLSPHFLFNTLNSIGVLLHRDPAGAELMLHQLAGLLRATLQQDRPHLVPLADDVEYLRAFVAIQAVRFEQRLQVVIDVEPASLQYAVPFLLLQPLVENAIVHGIAPRAAGGRIDVSGRCAGECLELTVRDDGVGRHGHRPPQAGAGVGLANTARRLEALFGAEHSLQLTDPPEGGFVVRIRLPLRLPEALA